MERYIGVKVVHAEPANHVDGRVQSPEVPISDDAKVEFGYKVVYPDGYESWSPKDVFEEAYRKTDGLTFGLAIEAMKRGRHIARHGWNGKGMFVVYQKGYPDGIPCNKQTAEAYGYEEGSLFRCRPYMQMRCADGTHQMWLATQSDVLAEDWYIVE